MWGNKTLTLGNPYTLIEEFTKEKSQYLSLDMVHYSVHDLIYHRDIDVEHTIFKSTHDTNRLIWMSWSFRVTHSQEYPEQIKHQLLCSLGVEKR